MVSISACHLLTRRQVRRRPGFNSQLESFQQQLTFWYLFGIFLHLFAFFCIFLHVFVSFYIFLHLFASFCIFLESSEGTIPTPCTWLPSVSHNLLPHNHTAISASPPPPSNQIFPHVTIWISPRFYQSSLVLYNPQISHRRRKARNLSYTYSNAVFT